MQSALYITPSSPPNLIAQWKPNKTHFLTPSLTLPKPSFKTPFHHQIQVLELNQPDPSEEPTSRSALPVAIRRSGGVSRYVWENGELKLVSFDENSMSLWDFEDGYRKLFRVCSLGLRNFFLPREISESYLGYVKWKLVHRVFSSALQVLATQVVSTLPFGFREKKLRREINESYLGYVKWKFVQFFSCALQVLYYFENALQVLATQAMFRAIGIGYSRSLPSAAALNWVLKDGLGRLSRCIYTASLASAFDTNLKRVRFSTSVMFSLSIGVELLTPAFPQYFLLLATVANIAKQISLACYLATGTAVHRSFAVADNLGEVSAKGQIQTVCFDNFGLMLAAALNFIVRNNSGLQAALPFLVYPIFSAMDLIGIYQGLKHVHLQTLTKDRLEIIINNWVKLGCVPSPAEVSKEEGIGLIKDKGRLMWPIRIGYIDPNRQISRLSMTSMRSLKEEDFYFISLEMVYSRLARNRQQGVVLCLREASGTSDVTMGLLQACYIREVILSSMAKWEAILEAAHDGADFVTRDWLELIEESKRWAHQNFVLLNDQMVDLGWACKNILLSTQEQVRYSFVDD